MDGRVCAKKGIEIRFDGLQGGLKRSAEKGFDHLADGCSRLERQTQTTCSSCVFYRGRS